MPALHIIVHKESVGGRPQFLPDQRVRPRRLSHPLRRVRRAIQLPGKFRQQFALMGQERIEVHRVQPGGRIEARGVVHPALPAAAVGIALNVPLQQPAPIGIPVGHIPAQIGAQLRIDLGQPIQTRLFLQHQGNAQGQHRGLGHRGNLMRIHHVRDEAIRALGIKNGRDHIPGQGHIEMTPTHGMENGIPQPHAPVRPAVGRGPAVRDPALRGAHLRLHDGENLGQGALGGRGQMGRTRLFRKPARPR